MKQLTINIWYVVAAIMGFTLIQSFYQSSKQYTTIAYSEFQTLLNQDKIDQLWIEQNTIQGTLKKPEKDGLKQFVTTRVAPDLAAELDKHHVTYTGEIPSTWLADLLSWVLPAVVFFGLWMFGARRRRRGGRQVLLDFRLGIRRDVRRRRGRASARPLRAGAQGGAGNRFYR
jgi:cell division protease FtsH